jgi:hypothetical protein
MFRTSEDRMKTWVLSAGALALMTGVATWRLMKRLSGEHNPSLLKLIEPFISDESPLSEVAESNDDRLDRMQVQARTAGG